MPARAESFAPMIVNSKNEAGAVELMLLAGMALLWAIATVVRLLLVPVAALLVVLLTPQRRPAPQPAPASPEAPEAPISAPEAPALPAVSLASVAADLLVLPAAELRRLAGTRRRCSKHELTAMICAMPI